MVVIPGPSEFSMGSPKDDAAATFTTAVAERFEAIGAQVLLGPVGRERLVAALAQLKNAGKEKEGDEPTGGKKARRTPKKPATDVKLMEKLEDRQDELRGELLQTRLLVGNAYFEKSKALPPGSPEWKAVVRGSAERYRKLFEKYPKWGAGLYARYYEGRNYLVLAQSETVPEERRKLLDTALLTLSSIRALDGESGFVPTLRAKSINASLECWLEMKLYEQFDDRLQKLSLLNSRCFCSTVSESTRSISLIR
jgi:hypothetical protein